MSLSSPAKVGLITVTALVILGMITVWKTEIFLLGRGHEMIASFENIEGLTVGSEVRFRGLKIGKVVKLDPGPYDIKVFSIVDRNLHIPADSILRVSYDGIVGMKFLEVKPGTSETMYQAPVELQGLRTSSLVDFIDLGAKNLVETKAILQAFRAMIENQQTQQSFANTMKTAERVMNEAEKLIIELRAATQGIANVTADPAFQSNLKGTIAGTDKTLTSANNFFESFGKMKFRTSGGVDLGTRANAVSGNIDIIQNEKSYFRFVVGEGPTRQLSVHDFLYSSMLNQGMALRLGIINNQLGGGIVTYPTETGSLISDIYDINNPKPKNPKLRFGYEYQFKDYLDVLLQADDVLNSGERNLMLGIRVKPLNERLY